MGSGDEDMNIFEGSFTFPLPSHLLTLLSWCRGKWGLNWLSPQMTTGACRVRCAAWSPGDPLLRDLGGTLMPRVRRCPLQRSVLRAREGRARMERMRAWHGIQAPGEPSTHSAVTKHGLGADQTQDKHTRQCICGLSLQLKTPWK